MANDKETKVAKIMFERYQNVISDNAEQFIGLPSKCRAPHLLRLCDEVIKHGDQYPFDKLCRWMGFIQGILAIQGLIDVDVERKWSRPILHSLHEHQPPSFG